MEQNFKVPNSTIRLHDYQVASYHKACSILETEPAYLDTSKMGLGKTVLTLSVAATYGMELIVIAPLTILNIWQTEAEKYSIPIIKTISYDSLRGTKTSPPKHGLCYRDENDVYVPSQEFIDMCRSKPILLVIDEVHRVKNSQTASLRAAHCLVRTITFDNEGSRVALLGETPGDKPEFVASIVKLLGIVTSEKMYHYDRTTREYDLLGILEVMEKARSYNKALADKIIEPIYFDRDTIDLLCLDLYEFVIKEHVSFGMTAPANASVKKICRNGYFDMSEEDVETLREGVSMLSKATRFRMDLGTIDLNAQSFPAVMKALTHIEHAKVGTAVRLARQTLTRDPQSKVILYFAYIDDMKRATEELEEFDPLLMFGETPPAERTAIEEKFQRPTGEYRLLISNPTVGGVGISMDDRDGAWPRTMFIIPSYHFINLQQCTGRIYRLATTKSDARIFFVYSKDFPHEVSILDSLLRKALTLRRIKNVNDADPLPGEYMSWFEGEGDRPNFAPTKVTKVQRAPAPPKKKPGPEFVPFDQIGRKLQKPSS